ncbi:MAG: hypothetical protein U9N72_00960 [Bacteroidota bacterium]|nr:hypothetical protein [Bacteroidota bacterium]
MKRAVGVILIVLTVVVLFFIGRHVPFGAGNSVFYVENVGRINRITISDTGRSVSLKLKSNGWYVNGENEARPQAIDFILRVLEDVRIKSPVSEKLYKEVLENENTREIEVKVFDNMKIIQSFYIYRNTEDEQPGIMRKRKKTKPFIVHIPGYEIDPSTCFLTDETYWLPFTVFELRPDQISEIHFKYFNKPDSSFYIEQDEREIRFSNEYYSNERIDTLAIGRYISYFIYVPFEKWAYDISANEKDSITSSKPYFSLEVITDHSDTTKLFTWKKQIKEANNIKEDTDRLWGSLNKGEDLFIIKYYDLDPLIKQPSYFIID